MLRNLSILAALLLAACASPERQGTAPGMVTLVNAPPLPAGPYHTTEAGYRIGPADKLSIRVFQVEDLSFDEIFVDASGDLQLPLIGTVHAAGLTAVELAAAIELRLGERYLRDPQVVVTVSEAASQKITVDGAVTEPGVYEMRGATTLVQAVAMAKGATRISNRRSVAVFRRGEGQRMVAVFDLAAIQAGQATDPVLQGDDIVVVDTSRLNSVMRDILAVLPSLATFVAYN